MRTTFWLGSLGRGGDGRAAWWCRSRCRGGAVPSDDPPPMPSVTHRLRTSFLPEVHGALVASRGASQGFGPEGGVVATERRAHTVTRVPVSCPEPAPGLRRGPARTRRNPPPAPIRVGDLPVGTTCPEVPNPGTVSTAGRRRPVARPQNHLVGRSAGAYAST